MSEPVEARDVTIMTGGGHKWTLKMGEEAYREVARASRRPGDFVILNGNDGSITIQWAAIDMIISGWTVPA